MFVDIETIPYLNLVSGIAIPAIQVQRILSSNNDSALVKNYCFAGEVGLSGEIRPVQRLEQRIMEAEKLGFEAIFISKQNKLSSKAKKVQIILLSKIEDLIVYL